MFRVHAIVHDERQRLRHQEENGEEENKQEENKGKEENKGEENKEEIEEKESVGKKGKERGDQDECHARSSWSLGTTLEEGLGWRTRSGVEPVNSSQFRLGTGVPLVYGRFCDRRTMTSASSSKYRCMYFFIFCMGIVIVFSNQMEISHFSTSSSSSSTDDPRKPHVTARPSTEPPSLLSNEGGGHPFSEQNMTLSFSSSDRSRIDEAERTIQDLKHQLSNLAPTSSIDCSHLPYKQSWVDKAGETKEKDGSSFPLRYHDRTCIMHNFCMNAKHGVFPRYSTVKIPTIPLNNDPINAKYLMAQLSSYINEGYEIYWTPHLQFNESFFDPISRVVEKKALMVYAPAAWPDKPPAHYFVNNMLPLFRALLNFMPQRFNMFPGHFNVWKYPIDILGCGGAFAPGANIISEEAKKLYDWLMVDEIFTMKNEVFMPQGRRILETPLTICYESIYAGVSGSQGHTWYQHPIPNRLNNDLLYSQFRLAFLNFQGCFPNGEGLQRQSTKQNPKVTFLQRDPSPNDASLGNRVIQNMKELDDLLKKKAEELEIDYTGFIKFNASIGLAEQACLIADTSIFIGIHGNAFGHEVFMEPHTVLLELSPKADFYRFFSEIKNVKYMSMEAKHGNTPDPTEFEAKVNEAIAYWRSQFS